MEKNYFFADCRTLGDIHKAYFSAGLDVMRLKRVKLQLEIMELNRRLKLTPKEMSSVLASANIATGWYIFGVSNC